MKPGVVAKLAAQVAASFDTAAAALRHRDLHEKTDTWPAMLDGQEKLFSAWAQFHLAKGARPVRVVAAVEPLLPPPP